MNKKDATLLAFANVFGWLKNKFVHKDPNKMSAFVHVIAWRRTSH